MSLRWQGALSLGAALVILVPHRTHADECPPGSVVLVDTVAHDLKLCEEGVALKHFPVAIGRGGRGKRRQGDDKTPLGVYVLGTPRPSARFGVFIPVGYPTKEQAAAGLTGMDVGIHGPDRQLLPLGRASLWVDWTAGCVAVGSDEAIHAIAAWVKSKRVARVQLN